MNSTKIRTALVALAAVAAISATGATGVASAATKAGGTTAQTTAAQPTSAHTSVRSATIGTHPYVTVGNSVVYTDAFPTGDGPADEEVCTNFAQAMDMALNRIRSALAEGDTDGAVSNQEALENLGDMAEDAGCAVIY